MVTWTDVDRMRHFSGPDGEFVGGALRSFVQQLVTVRYPKQCAWWDRLRAINYAMQELRSYPNLDRNNPAEQEIRKFVAALVLPAWTPLPDVTAESAVSGDIAAGANMLETPPYEFCQDSGNIDLLAIALGLMTRKGGKARDIVMSKKGSVRLGDVRKNLYKKVLGAEDAAGIDSLDADNEYDQIELRRSPNLEAMRRAFDRALVRRAPAVRDSLWLRNLGYPCRSLTRYGKPNTVAQRLCGAHKKPPFSDEQLRSIIAAGFDPRDKD